LFFFLIGSFLESFCVPITEFDDCWNCSNHNEEVKDKDSDQNSSMSEEGYFSIKDDLQMLDEVSHNHF
jgi:hypothetical protein